ANSQNARDAGRVRRTRPAEADHRVVARVLALLDQVNARSRRHALGYDLVDAPGRLHRRKADLLAKPADRPLRRLAVERHAAAEKEGWVVEPEHQVGIRDG